MVISVILYDESNNYLDRVDINNVIDKNNFSYFDNENNECKIRVYDDGICLLKKDSDHSLKLNLRKECYAEVITDEGKIKIDAKVVDFILNDDILVVRYVIDDVKREIRIIYGREYDS